MRGMFKINVACRTCTRIQYVLECLRAENGSTIEMEGVYIMSISDTSTESISYGKGKASESIKDARADATQLVELFNTVDVRTAVIDTSGKTATEIKELARIYREALRTSHPAVAVVHNAKETGKELRITMKADATKPLPEVAEQDKTNKGK